MKMFDLGHTVATPGALEALENAGASAFTYLGMHQQGYWGEVDTEDWQANERALILGARLFSVFTLKTGVKIWVITVADRSGTCLLLPEEY